MRVLVRNQADLPNKYVRFVKWKILQLQRKYNKLLYAEVFIQKEGSSPEIYKVNVVLGVPGPDIVLQAKSSSIRDLYAELSAKMDRQIAKYSKISTKRSKGSHEQ